ncbi:MAG: hypothetical protein EP343_25835 [Deltaproteobacteria bacterium]|nr:MAG: hypothetical protein EP343_25835 [Deltaproteobacteria bacterium]
MSQAPESLQFQRNPENTTRFPQPEPGDRDWYAYEALRMLPRIITMIDKNRFSPTYGCFDREFWHYRTVDFPCGMNQEFCLPLAMAYKHPFPQNPYYKVERLKELVVASIEFAVKTSHGDGSCDDYFPFERALGALVFSTYAMTESYLVLDLNRPDLLDFFRKRGDWLLNNNETGQLANHQAFAALALYNVYLLTREEKYRKGSDHFRDITLDWQHEEGWFQEYEGADPGYHSCSIAFLSKLYQKSKDESLIEPLVKAVEFAAYFMHPDGSYAGEYGSRNTYHFYPHGFEVMSHFTPVATQIAETYLQRALPERRRYYNDDNRMCAHYVYDWMQAWLDHNPARHGTLEENRGSFARWFDDAKLYVKKTPHYYAVLSMAKGGVLKVFTEDGPYASDTGLMLQTLGGETLVTHLVDEQTTIAPRPDDSTFVTEGFFSRRRSPLSSPVKQILFRTMNLTVGRFNANAVRSVLQKILITGKPRTQVRFRREFVFHEDRIEIRDSIDASKENLRFKHMAAASDSTSIYVANSNTFQESTLLPWRELDSYVSDLNRSKTLELPPHIIRFNTTKSN